MNHAKASLAMHLMAQAPRELAGSATRIAWSHLTPAGCVCSTFEPGGGSRAAVGFSL
jgi:hypothetical protein